jgi:hypothetical protein
MSKKLTTSEVKLKIAKDFPDYELVGEYLGSSKPITLRHILCYKTYTVKRAKTFLTENGGKCPYCKENKFHSTKKLTEEDFKAKINSIYGNEYSYIKGYKNTHTKCTIKHNVCDNTWEVTPQMFIGKKQRKCPYCANKNRGNYQQKENYLNNILKDNNLENEYKWLEDYKGNNKEKHSIKHLICGNVYSVRPNDFQQGYRCPYCSRKNSAEEDSLYQFIKDN